ncbi:archease [Polyangium jinanense]|uniref:Archease n=1 Tax=Polyangium jinanense TaxID=2829994 RepID=A0A9X3XF06_9BACT|nr:archease [Polyangium jinanense]MDC3989409.1 archease [Polyangium jinanense]
MTSGPEGPRHTFEDHTAELRLGLFAPTFPELFAEAGRALAELAVGEGPLPEAAGEGVSISLHSVDREALLVDWMNELVFHTEVDGRVYVDFHFDELAPDHLVARVRGAEVQGLRPLVKAATLHDVHITEDSHGYSVHVVLDI